MYGGIDIYKWIMHDIYKEQKEGKYVKGYVCCKKCKRTGVTLRKIKDEYICNDCYKELQNG